jgi:two-component system sensor histidine kinase HydH
MRFRYSTRFARWGLLGTAIALGATLVTTGVLAQLSASETASAVTRTFAGDTLLDVRSAIFEAGLPDSGVLKTILERFERDGLRFIAVVGPEGTVGSAGTAMAPVEWLPLSEPPGAAWDAGTRGQAARALDSGAGLHPGAAPRLERIGRRRIRVSAPLRPQPAPASSSDRMSGWRELPGLDLPAQRMLVIEFEPILADDIRSRAQLTLLTGIITSAVLLIVVVLFWRGSRRAEVAAEEAERDRQLRALGQMSAILGHELRNPLASLKGHAQLLLEKLPGEHQGRRGAETIVREAVRLEELASEVLEFVRTGSVQPAIEDPAAVAQEAVDASQVDGVRLAVHVEVRRWMMDRAKIGQVLVNLLKNARESATDGSEILLVVREEAGALVYEVEDRGEGLPPGEEERAFEPFFTRRAKGTGLGLALARRIVEGHAGTIRAENRAGGGATFRITLPRDAATS